MPGRSARCVTASRALADCVFRINHCGRAPWPCRQFHDGCAHRVFYSGRDRLLGGGHGASLSGCAVNFRNCAGNFRNESFHLGHGCVLRGGVLEGCASGRGRRHRFAGGGGLDGWGRCRCLLLRFGDFAVVAAVGIGVLSRRGSLSRGRGAGLKLCARVPRPIGAAVPLLLSCAGQPLRRCATPLPSGT